MHFDAIIVGAGAAGLMCALQAAKRGRKILILDHSAQVGGKILISGGGRCNFTNIGTTPANFVSSNPHFCKSALSRYSPDDFIEMLKTHKIEYYEKKLGQLFCKNSARDIVNMLEKECQNKNIEIKLGVSIQSVTKENVDDKAIYKIQLGPTIYTSQSLVVATGGLSIPKLKSSDWGYRLAKQFSLNVTQTDPALDGFVLGESSEDKKIKELSGLSLDCIMTANNMSFRENILFTHKGLSGPASLQASLHWKHGDEISINLLPDMNLGEVLKFNKEEKQKTQLKNYFTQILPSRFAEVFIDLFFNEQAETPLCQLSDKLIEEIAYKTHNWKFIPQSTVGYSKAEVTRGGVDTNELSSKTMEAKKVSGLYFIGEVVDVTGWLGGYNFQWAWASAWAAAQNI